MQQFKIEDFAKDYPGIPFPWHRTLRHEQRAAIVAQLKADLGLPEDADAPTLAKEIDRSSKEILDFNLND